MKRRTAEEQTMVEFTLTPNSLEEGGRPRHPHEACLNVAAATFGFFAGREITIVTDDGRGFPALLGGSSGRNGRGVPKNLRSRPATALGEWLAYHRAAPGDVVRATRLADGRFRFAFVRAVTAQGERQAA